MLTEITKKVILRSQIPEELRRFGWFNLYELGSLVEAHISDDSPYEVLDQWFEKNYLML